MTSEVRALSLTRHPDGGDDPDQREVFADVCAARGWLAGGAIRLNGWGTRGVDVAVRLVLRRRYDVIVVSEMDHLAKDTVGILAILTTIRRAGVRLFLIAEGIDSGAPEGAALLDTLITEGAVV